MTVLYKISHLCKSREARPARPARPRVHRVRPTGHQAKGRALLPRLSVAADDQPSSPAAVLSEREDHLPASLFGSIPCTTSHIHPDTAE